MSSKRLYFETLSWIDNLPLGSSSSSRSYSNQYGYYMQETTEHRCDDALCCYFSFPESREQVENDMLNHNLYKWAFWLKRWHKRTRKRKENHYVMAGLVCTSEAPSTEAWRCYKYLKSWIKHWKLYKLEQTQGPVVHTYLTDSVRLNKKRHDAMLYWRVQCILSKKCKSRAWRCLNETYNKKRVLNMLFSVYKQIQMVAAFGRWKRRSKWPVVIEFCDKYPISVMCRRWKRFHRQCQSNQVLLSLASFYVLIKAWKALYARAYILAPRIMMIRAVDANKLLQCRRGFKVLKQYVNDGRCAYKAEARAVDLYTRSAFRRVGLELFYALKYCIVHVAVAHRAAGQHHRRKMLRAGMSSLATMLRTDTTASFSAGRDVAGGGMSGGDYLPVHRQPFRLVPLIPRVIIGLRRWKRRTALCGNFKIAFEMALEIRCSHLIRLWSLHKRDNIEKKTLMLRATMHYVYHRLLYVNGFQKWQNRVLCKKQLFNAVQYCRLRKSVRKWRVFTRLVLTKSRTARSRAELRFHINAMLRVLHKLRAHSVHCKKHKLALDVFKKLHPVTLCSHVKKIFIAWKDEFMPANRLERDNFKCVVVTRKRITLEKVFDAWIDARSNLVARRVILTRAIGRLKYELVKGKAVLHAAFQALNAGSQLSPTSSRFIQFLSHITKTASDIGSHSSSPSDGTLSPSLFFKRCLARRMFINWFDAFKNRREDRYTAVVRDVHALHIQQRTFSGWMRTYKSSLDGDISVHRKIRKRICKAIFFAWRHQYEQCLLNKHIFQPLMTAMKEQDTFDDDIGVEAAKRLRKKDHLVFEDERKKLSIIRNHQMPRGAGIFLPSQALAVPDAASPSTSSSSLSSLDADPVAIFHTALSVDKYAPPPPPPPPHPHPHPASPGLYYNQPSPTLASIAETTSIPSSDDGDSTERDRKQPLYRTGRKQMQRALFLSTENLEPLYFPAASVKTEFDANIASINQKGHAEEEEEEEEEENDVIDDDSIDGQDTNNNNNNMNMNMNKYYVYDSGASSANDQNTFSHTQDATTSFRTEQHMKRHERHPGNPAGIVHNSSSSSAVASFVAGSSINSPGSAATGDSQSAFYSSSVSLPTMILGTRAPRHMNDDMLSSNDDDVNLGENENDLDLHNTTPFPSAQKEKKKKKKKKNFHSDSTLDIENNNNNNHDNHHQRLLNSPTSRERRSALGATYSNTFDDAIRGGWSNKSSPSNVRVAVERIVVSPSAAIAAPGSTTSPATVIDNNAPRNYDTYKGPFNKNFSDSIPYSKAQPRALPTKSNPATSSTTTNTRAEISTHATGGNNRINANTIYSSSSSSRNSRPPHSLPTSLWGEKTVEQPRAYDVGRRTYTGQYLRAQQYRNSPGSAHK